MDYTKQELRPLIYEDRNSIDDFDVNDPESLDAEMLKRIEDSEIVELDGASRYILEIFNNAYYITTLILMEPHPVHYLYKYLTIANHAGSAYEDVREKNTYHSFFECITMAMVWNYLSACLPDKYALGNEDRLLKSIWDYHYKHFDDTEWDGHARFLFFNNVMRADKIQKYHVQDKFMPLHSPEQLKAMEEGTLQPEDTLNIEKTAELEAQLNAQEQNFSDNGKQEPTELEKEQEQEIARLKNDLEAFKTQNGKTRMTASQAAMFLLTVCHHLGKLPNDKKKLTPILEQGWDFTETTASRALGSKPSQKVADEAASIFESVSPKLARLIKEFPQTFEAIRINKLKANNEKKVKNK